MGQALGRNVRSCCLDAVEPEMGRRKEETQVAETASVRVPMRGAVADRPVVAMKPGNAGGVTGPDDPGVVSTQLQQWGRS